MPTINVDNACSNYPEINGNPFKDCDLPNKAATDPVANFSYDNLAGLSSVEQQCLFVLRKSVPIPTQTVAVQYARAAVTLHVFVRHEAKSDFTPSSIPAPLISGEKCQTAHKYIWKSLRLCYESCLGTEHNGLVKSLIQEILYCEQDLGVIFSILKKSPTSDIEGDILYQSAKPYNCRHLLALEYYMSFIDATEYIGSVPSLSLTSCYHSFLNSPSCFTKTNLPLNIAASSANADAILLLLRYGADPFACVKNSIFERQDDKPGESAVSILVSSLNCLAFVKRRCQTKETEQFLFKEETNIIQCLRYAHRSVKTLSLISSTSPKASTLWNNPEEKNEKLTVLSVFWPKLVENGLVEFPLLQHLSRCAIRQHLSRVNWKPIPWMITSLPLPGRLKSYLNLYHD